MVINEVIIPLEDLGSAAVVGDEEADGNVLGGYKIRAHADGEVDGGLERSLAAGGEGQVGGHGGRGEGRRRRRRRRKW